MSDYDLRAEWKINATYEPNHIQEGTAAKERMELYCKAHPGSPSTVRRPRLSLRSGTWVALLGKSVSKGIVGFGLTVEAALRAFDAQYLNNLRPPALETEDAA